MVKDFKNAPPGGAGGAARGGFSGGRGGFGGRGGRGGGFRGGRGPIDYGTPASVVPTGNVMHPCQEYVICRNLIPTKVPIFNRPVYNINKEKIGVVDEVFGPINDFVSLYFF